MELDFGITQITNARTISNLTKNFGGETGASATLCTYIVGKVHIESHWISGHYSQTKNIRVNDKNIKVIY
jgi:hypothetical protein